MSRRVKWFIAQRLGKFAALPTSSPQVKTEKIKARMRVKVMHPFYLIKRVFKYRKVSYRGLAKNTNRLYVLVGLTNLLRMKSCLSL
ncbi:MAG TPA: hypothetical protein DIW64_01820 [Cellvibrio sp.]|nr:hypothetical protein [Cellvibrio sp.]